MLPLSISIGLRFVCSRYRSSTVSVLSVISIFSITLGVAVLIISLSAMNGFKNELNNRILSVIPHSEIEPIDQPWNNWSDALIKIEKVPAIVAATPYINFIGIAESGTNMHVIHIRGMSLQQKVQFGMLLQFLQNNTLGTFRPGKKQIILGKGIADSLNIKQGEQVSIMIPNFSNKNNNLQPPKRLHFHVIDILKLNSQIDHNLAIVPLEDAQKYMNMGNSITGISIKINDIFNVNKVIHEVGKVIDDHVYIKSWVDTYGYIYHDIQIIRTIIYLAIVLMISMACFNIISILMIAVKEKSGDIAVLRTLGAQDQFIIAIFIWYGLLIGLFGIFFGTVIGVIISTRLTSIISKIENITGCKFLSGNIYFIDFLPSELQWQDSVYVLMITLILSIIASIFPAYRASCIDPAKILSNS